MANTSSRKRPAKRRQGRHSARKRPSLWRSLVSLGGWSLLGVAALGAIALGGYMLHLDGIIRDQFEGKRWALPARVYARPLELFLGAEVGANQFAKELELLRYRQYQQTNGPGTFVRDGDTFQIHTRGFAFSDGTEPPRRVQVSFDGGQLQDLVGLDGEDPGIMRIEPLQYAGIYPTHQQDRILVQREDIPDVLVDALLAVEDRAFYDHFGVNLKGVARALVANIKAGRTVQGGSTLTQQLVKNYFLSNERTYTRKIIEMMMATLLEWHYDKDEILEAYANEVYLGQDGSRAIHGLGLASRFYFDRPLSELSLHHVALLVGLVRGPSEYNPRRYPERALDRRALVLDVMAQQNLISQEDANIAKNLPLDVSGEPPSGISPYPAFLELVQRQLQEDYREEDLTSEGLKIFTTLDPQIQAIAEQRVVEKLPDLEKQANLQSGILQSAAIVVDTQSGELKALVGGRDVRLAGFNRALDAKRLPGSVIKPIVYLTALEFPDRYTLASILDDSRPVVYRSSSGERWNPGNYDNRFHGMVMLQDALAKSYNIPTVRIGLDVDVIRVVETMQRLGLERKIRPFPALLLGAVDLAPIEVAQMYQTIASGGFRMPLRTIREVTADDGANIERRYQLTLDKAIEAGPTYLITTAMQRVVSNGTGRRIESTLDKDLNIAGKTGTTNDYRDSWFAGFSGNVLTVVWVGRDDNKPTRLSGSRGALPVWIDIMRELDLVPLELTPPPEIETALIDPSSGRLANRDCTGSIKIPFLAGSAPRSRATCAPDYLVSDLFNGGDNSAQGGAPGATSGQDGYNGFGNPGSGVQRRGPAPNNNPVGNFFRRLQE